MHLINHQALPKVRQRLEQADPSLTPAMDRLRAEADEVMQRGPWSVMDKPIVPPSGDKHDYMSIGTYWWPNPDKPDGLPYVRRDGHPNPEYDRLDGGALRALRPTLDTLCLAFALTGDERYAQRATLLLRTWYLDEATRMNPHLRFGQAIPGICEGRGIGIVDTSQSMTNLPDQIALLRDAQAWTARDEQGMRDWVNEYLDWLLTSEHGNDEAAQHNNHGTWYDLLVVALARFTDREHVARRVLRSVPALRIAPQIEPDGRQPAELARTLAFTYSVVNLLGLFRLASLGETFEIDLWHYQTDDGRCIRRALDWLADYADPRTPWPYQQIRETPHRSALYTMLRRGAAVYDDARYQQVLDDLPADQTQTDRLHLLDA